MTEYRNNPPSYRPIRSLTIVFAEIKEQRARKIATKKEESRPQTSECLNLLLKKHVVWGQYYESLGVAGFHASLTNSWEIRAIRG
jgi:hypothetical protein